MPTDTLPTGAASALARLRSSLHHFVDAADNIGVLEAMEKLFYATLPPSAFPHVDEPVRLEDLPLAVRESVEAGLRDIEAGRVVPHEQVMAEMRARYGRTL